MPSFKVKPESLGIVPTGGKGKDTKYYPTVYFPVNKEILDSIEVGQEVMVEIKGVVKMLESRQEEGRDKNECKVELREVSVYSKNEYEELAEDESED